MDARQALRLCALPMLLLVGGCVGAATEGANIARDKVVVANNIEAAEAGDPEAQYKVGDALCCSVHEGRGFYNTQEAVDWLCRAAEQEHGPAALKLGEIYAGDVVSGVRLMRRVAQGLAGNSTNLPVAYAWLRRAEAAGQEDASEPAQALWHDLSRNQRSQAEAMAEGRQSLPCEWSSVIGTS